MSTATAGPALDLGHRTGSASRRARRLLSAVVVGLVFLILLGLGSWQLQRLAWKTDLLRRVAALQASRPRPLAPVLEQLAKGEDVDFTRVTATCPALEQTPTLRLYALRESMGYRLITACPLVGAPFRSILVDRGFVARDDADKVRASAEPLSSPVTGVLRKGDKPGWFTPAHAGKDADWYGRDVPAMAAALGATGAAPIFLMLESPAPRGFGPTPSPLPTEIRNPHLGYALTWFGLALALAGVSGAALLRSQRQT